MSSDGSPLLFRTVPALLRLRVSEKKTLHAFAQTLSQRLAGGLPFSCLITNDKHLQTLNRDFLGHDYPTDVLSFPQQPGSDTFGDLAISIERAQAQADEFGHSLVEELRVLMLHGVLHLAGFDHESDRGEMAKRERELRLELGLLSSLISRVRSRRAPHAETSSAQSKVLSR